MISWIASLFHHRRSSIDVAASRELVEKLALPPETKQFVLALRVPDDPSCVVYVLTAGVLSQRSAQDVERLVRALTPHSVLAQVESDMMADCHEEQQIVKDLDAGTISVPSSSVNVIKECFLEKLKHGAFDQLARAEAMRILFGTTYHGHIIAAKEAALASRSAFYYLLTPSVQDFVEKSDQEAISRSNKSFASILGSHRLGPLFASSSQKPVQNSGAAISPVQWPAFIAPLFPLFIAMDEINKAIPGTSGTDVGHALLTAQKVLMDVEHGNEVNQEELALVCRFRVTLEYLRLLLNDVVRNRALQKAPSPSFDFDELPYEEKCHVLLAKALQNQARRSKVVVALVDGSKISGLLKYWNVRGSSQLSALADTCLLGDEAEAGENKPSAMGKPVLVVSAGAAAVVGVTSLSYMTKVLTFKVPVIMKLGLLHAKKGVATVFSKIVVFPSSWKLSSWFWASTSKTAAVKVTTGKIGGSRALVALAERGSMDAIRTAFYGVMQKQERMPRSRRPWLAFGGSVLTTACLFWNEDRIKSTLDAVPSAFAVAQLGKGIQNLKHTAEKLREIETSQMWDEIYSILYRMAEPGRKR